MTNLFKRLRLRYAVAVYTFAFGYTGSVVWASLGGLQSWRVRQALLAVALTLTALAVAVPAARLSNRIVPRTLIGLPLLSLSFVLMAVGFFLLLGACIMPDYD